MTIALLAGLVLTNRLSAPVDFEAAGLRADYAVAALGKAAGVEMRAKVALNDTTVAIRFKGVPLDDAMKRLAKALGATWTKDGDAYVLDRPGITPQQREQIRARQAAAACKVYLTNYKLIPHINAESLAQIDREIHTKTAGNEAGKASELLQKNSPEERMLVTLAKSVGPDALGKVPPGGRAVYSLHPTRMQIQLPSSSANFASEWLQEERAFQEFAKTSKEYEWHSHRFADGKVPTPNELTDLWLIIERSKGSLTLWVNAYNAKGESPFQMQSSLMIPLEQSRDYDLPKPTIDTEAKFEPSERAKFGSKFARLWESLKIDRNKLAAVLPSLADETQGAPLLAGPAEALMAWAKEKDLNLVAVMPESGMTSADGNDSLIEAKGLLENWLRGDRAKTTVQDGWITLVPTDPFAERVRRTPRRAVFYLLDKGVRQYKLTLDDLSDVAAQLDDADFSDVLEMVSRALGLPDQVRGDAMDVRALRLYGMLNKDERKRVQAGERVEVSPSTRGQMMAETDRIVFRTKLRVVPPGTDYVKFGKEDDIAWMTGNSWTGGPKAEATYTYGGGMPPAIRLAFQIMPLTAVYSHQSNNQYGGYERVSLLGSYLDQRAMSRANDAEYEKDNVAATVQMTRLGVMFDFGDTGWASVNMIWPDDMRPQSYGAPSGVIAQFPEQYAAAVKKFGG